MRWIGRGLTIVVGLALLGLAGFNVWLRWNIHRHSLPEAEKAALAAGLVLSPKDLHRPTWPRAQDAGPDWLAIAKRRDINLHSRAENDAYQSTKSTRLAPEQVVRLRQIVAAQRPVMAAVRKAAAKPHARFKHAFTVGELSPYLEAMRSAVQRMQMESAVLAAGNRPVEAVRAVAPALRIAQQAGEDPTVISMVVSSACERLATQSLGQILQASGDNPEAVAAVSGTLRAYHSSRDLRACIQGEVLTGVDARKELTRNTSNAGGLSEALGDANAAAYLGWMARYYGASGLRGNDRLAAIRALDGARDRVAAKRLKDPAQMLSTSLAPSLGRAIMREGWTNAMTACILAGADVLEARARTGAWPERLPHAIPDPCRPEKSLGYRCEPRGFVVYSGGPTGRFTAAGGQPTRFEAYFRYPRAASAEGGHGGPR